MKMIKHLAALFFFSVLTNSLFAQSLNVSGGFTSTTFKHTMFEEYVRDITDNSSNVTEISRGEIKRLPTYNAGLSFEFKLNKILSFEPGLRYQTRGFQFHEMLKLVSDGTEVHSYNLDFTYKENYIDFPLVLNAGANFGDFSVYGRGGLYGGVLRSRYTRITYNITSYDGYFENLDETELLKGRDLDFDERITAGFLFGVGVKYKGFYLEANHNNSLVTSYEVEGMSRDFSINAGYKFQLRK
jgi:hypothetical protein